MNKNRILLSLIFLAASTAIGEVVRIDVERSHEIANGTSYALAGSYEGIVGKIHYAVDPDNSINQIITDISHAATNSAGLVEFSTDFYLIKPLFFIIK